MFFEQRIIGFQENSKPAQVPPVPFDREGAHAAIEGKRKPLPPEITNILQQVGRNPEKASKMLQMRGERAEKATLDAMATMANNLSGKPKTQKNTAQTLSNIMTLGAAGFIGTRFDNTYNNGELVASATDWMTSGAETIANASHEGAQAIGHVRGVW